MKNDKIIPIGETAKLLGVSIQTLRRWDERGILPSFRASTSGNRFYREWDLKLFLNDLPAIAWKWVSDNFPYEPPKDFYCRTSDIFVGRLERLKFDLQKIHDLGIHFSLLASMVGEIGDNSYAHNLGNWPDVLGIFFAYDLNKRVVVLSDRGRGVLETLKAAPTMSGLVSHQEALDAAFTKVVSGRFPERRGNGLKSVRENILTSNVELLFRTGNAQLDLKKGDQKLNISECETFHGCFALLKF